MRRVAPIFFLFLAACSTKPPTYEKGAGVRPAPVVMPGHTATPAGTGAGIAPRDFSSRGVPPSPHRRVLPSTPEPGLWSGDKPRASAESEPPDAPLSELAKHLQPQDDEDPEVNVIMLSDPWRLCYLRAQERLRDSAANDSGLRQLGKKQQTCVAAQMLHHCLAKIIGPPPLLPHSEFIDAAFKAKGLAQTAGRMACANEASEHIDPVVRALTNGWALP